MKCEKCGAEIDSLYISIFNRDGSDSEHLEKITEEQSTGAVCIETNPNWTGYELSEEEKLETITCPKCRQFPFKNKELQTYDIVRIVCFKESEERRDDVWQALPEMSVVELYKALLG